VFIYRPVVKGSVEEKILLRQVDKENLANLIVENKPNKVISNLETEKKCQWDGPYQ
jgi:SNF2 family DNA or RNA helicase